MEENITQAAPQAEVEVVDIQFRPGQKVYFFDPAGLRLRQGDHVIIDTARGAEFGICAGCNHTIAQKDVVAPLRRVLRVATAQDERIVAANRQREQNACTVCQQKIQELGLDMQLVSAECAFDGSKMLFFFTADERVDFRELVKILASNFHTRIELRQIGVRDKAKMVGGLGICGRPFCCASFLDDFQPVSIKMAKTQNLSLNPAKISGTCGRLMCCLKYEQEAYEDLIRRSPKEESFVDTPEGRGTVVEVNLLRQQVKVRMENDPDTVSVFSNEEIAVYRSGKARKTDAPIPEDWAPVSGNGKRERKTEQNAPRFLDPIRFRYSEETITEDPVIREQEQEPVAEDVSQEQKQKNRRRRNRSKGPKQESQTAQEPRPEGQDKPKHKPQKQQKKQPQQPVPAQPESPVSAEGEKPHRRSGHRRNYRKQGKPAEE